MAIEPIVILSLFCALVAGGIYVVVTHIIDAKAEEESQQKYWSIRGQQGPQD